MAKESVTGAGAISVSGLRAAEADALTRAGEAQRRIAKAQAGAEADFAATELLRRRIEAEELATRQALLRAEAEREAESAAAERAHAERLLEIATRARVDAEEKALQDAKRREFAAHELARAARERLERERQAESLARERAEADRHAADLALERQRHDASLEASRLARQAAEVDARQQLARRQVAERDAQLMAERVAQMVEVDGRSEQSAATRPTPHVKKPRSGPVSSQPARLPRTWLIVVCALISAVVVFWLFRPSQQEPALRPGSLSLERTWPATSNR